MPDNAAQVQRRPARHDQVPDQGRRQAKYGVDLRRGPGHRVGVAEGRRAGPARHLAARIRRADVHRADAPGRGPVCAARRRPAISGEARPQRPAVLRRRRTGDGLARRTSGTSRTSDGPVVIGDIDGMPDWLAAAAPTPGRTGPSRAGPTTPSTAKPTPFVIDGLALLGVTPARHLVNPVAARSAAGPRRGRIRPDRRARTPIPRPPGGGRPTPVKEPAWIRQ
jgi:hypothetical protein